jgi:hypothetical protein
MTKAPERIWMDPDIKFPECEKQYGCDVEYVRADMLHEIFYRYSKAETRHIEQLQERVAELEARVAEVREEALREAAEVAAEEANWVPHKSDDFRKAILALIEKDQ